MFAQICVSNAEAENNERSRLSKSISVIKNEDIRRVAVVRTALALFFTPLLEPVRYL